MNWRKKQGYLNENFTWIKCSQEENEIFVYDKINLGFRSMKIYRERRFELEHFMADVVYQRARPLPEKVVIGKKRPSKKKSYYVKVGKERIELFERSKAELYQSYKEFEKNLGVNFFYVDNNKTALGKNYFSQYDRNCKSEAVYNGGREIIYLIRESLKRQGL